MRQLVSLNWNHPLPTAVVALTLRPDALLVVAPQDGADAIERLRRVLATHGMRVEVALGEDATDLDRGAPGSRMRDVIEAALTDASTVLDYTGGSKLMAAAARLAIEPGGAARAVYLDQDGTLRWDDGRAQPAGQALDIADVAALHGTRVESAGARLADQPELLEVAADAAGLVEALHRGATLLFWKDLRTQAKAAPNGDETAIAEIRAAAADVVAGRRYMLPLFPGSKGDWLEGITADAVERTFARHGVAADVRVSVKGRRRELDVVPDPWPREHPAAMEVFGALRERSLGATGHDLDDAIDALLEADALPPVRKQQSGHDLEVDVVALRGHRVWGLSCYGGRDDDEVLWKSREIARRMEQLGGDLAPAGFVCLYDRGRCAALQAELAGEASGRPVVSVFGLDDLADWTADPPRLERLATFLGLDDRPRAGEAVVPADTDHDLLVTVGGTPLPVFQAVLAHGAVRPLLLHSPGSTLAAQRLTDALARRGIRATCVLTPSAFLVEPIDAVLAQLPPAPALDLTGGTKVLATRALLRHAANAGVASVTYIDGRNGAMRSLAVGAGGQPLPSVSVAEALALRGWAIEPRGELPVVFGTPEGAVPPELKARLVAGLVATLGDDAEVLTDLRIVSPATNQIVEFGVLVRWRWRFAVVALPWFDDAKAVAEAAWPVMTDAGVALGEYARVLVLTKLDDKDRDRVQRQLGRRSAGAAVVRLFGGSDLDADAGFLRDALVET